MALTKTTPNGSRTRRVLKWTGAALVIVAVIGGVLGSPRISIAYHEWHAQRLVRQGRADLEKHDLRNAWLRASRAFQIRPRNVEVLRLAADICGASALQREIGWRQQVLQVQSDRAEDHLALARAAMRYGEIDLARQTILNMPAETRQGARYFEMVAAVATASKDWATAVSASQRALALEPTNETFEFNLATLELFHSDPAVRAQARAVVKRSRNHPEFRLPSLRTLVGDALGNGDANAALDFARELQSTQGANFSDHLLLLEALNQAKPAEAPRLLGELQQQAATDPLNVGTLLSWMSAHGQAAEARAWAANLPAPITQVPVVALRLAEANLRLADWAALESLTKDAQWGDVEILRLAFLCRALRETGQEDAAAIQWRAALANAKKNPSILPQTTDMLAAWGWGKERRELLWVAADLSKEVGWALRSLYQDYMAAGETNNLLRVATKMAELEPKSPDVQNNVACLLLLLNRHAVTPFATDSAFVSARDLYQRFPTDPRYVSTYAYALHVRGNSAEALKIMQTLRQEQLAEPATALYYGVLLSARGEVAEAAKYLALAAGNAKLLPEEKQLLEEARLAAR